MERIQFKTKINAPRERVWAVLWDDETYRKWTGVFTAGSCAESDWEEGSRILFLDGSGDGMYSVIAKKILNEFMGFKHLGSIKDGKEIPFAGDTASWADSEENYTLTESDGVTELTADLDTSEELNEFMMEKFPLALARVKELAEHKKL